MGIYIPGMELPTPQLTDGPSVYSAYIIVETDGRAAIVVDDEEGLDSTEYSLVNVPPHGRLIDADVTQEILCQDYAYAAVDLIREVPTIIPAEEAQP